MNKIHELEIIIPIVLSATEEMKYMRANDKGSFGALGIILFALLSFAQPLAADVSGAFSQGRKHFTIYGGTGYAFNDDYLVLGLSGSYFITDGLNIGLAYESWSGGSPGISKVTPSMLYVFYQSQTIKPYVGAFYRRTYIDNLPDLESAGGRAGVYLSSGNAYVSVGGVYESYLDCEESIYRKCDDTYPEIGITFVF